MTKKFDKLYESIRQNHRSYNDEIEWELYKVIEDFDESRLIELRGNDDKYEYSKKALEHKPYGTGRYSNETEMESIGSMEGF